MSGYVLSVDADPDLDDIWEYIAADNIDAADRWIETFFDAFETLAQTPRLVYRSERSPIEIVAVTQGSRDVPAFLNRRIRH